MDNEMATQLIRHGELAKTNKLIATCCSLDEAMVLYTTTLQHRPSAVFECGTGIGWSSMWLAAGANNDEHHRHTPNTERNIPVFSFDIGARVQQFNHPHVAKIIGDYRENVRTFAPPYLDRKKLFFIDGEHSNEGVKLDFDATTPFLELGDKIIFHDVKSEQGSRKFDAHLQSLCPLWRREHYDTYNGIVVYTVM